MYFKDLKIGDIFTNNGNKCKKQSTRTALLTDYNRVFYFGQNEICEV